MQYKASTSNRIIHPLPQISTEAVAEWCQQLSHVWRCAVLQPSNFQFAEPHLHVYGCVVEAGGQQRLQPCQVGPHVVGAVAGQVGDDQQPSLNSSRVARRGQLLAAATAKRKNRAQRKSMGMRALYATSGVRPGSRGLLDMTAPW
jgi:hypothetical protein